MQISFLYMQKYASEKPGSLRYNARPGLPQQLVRAGALAQTLCGNQNGVLTAALNCHTKQAAISKTEGLVKHWTGISEFVAVAELQSFTKAAKQLGISVAQVSRNIAELEASLAIKLLYRSTRSVSLTEEGLLYLQHCKHLVASLEEANRTLANLKATPRGQIKLTAPVFYGETRIAPLLHDFIPVFGNFMVVNQSYIYFSEKEFTTCFSKVYNHEINPAQNLAAIMTCSDAEDNCPFIPGCDLRIGTTYNDPKAFDTTILQDEKYTERSNQIAMECLYVFSKVVNK